MSKNAGKKFEDDFYNSLVEYEDIYIHRIRDVQFYRGSTSIGDYIVFKAPKLYLLELKSVKGISITVSTKTDENGNITHFGNINKKQFDMMLDIENEDIVVGYILNFRKNQNTFYLSAEQVLDFLVDKTITRKSIPESYCERHGVKLNQSIKRTRYTYYDDFLDKIK